MNNSNLKKIYTYQMIITAAVGTALFITTPHRAIPFFLGSLVITLNFTLLAVLWKRVLDKKPVAITLGLIITKYAVLAGLVFMLARGWSQHMLSVFLGLTTLVVSFLVLAFSLLLAKKN